MNNEFSYVVLFTLGLFSSFHCIGMCGGVISALTFGLDQKIRDNKVSLAVYLFAYNFGRLLSYAIAGLITGYIGATLVGIIGIDAAHNVTKFFSAIMIILIGLYIAGCFPQLSKLESLGAKLWKKIQPLGQRFIPVKSPLHAICFGMIWGWLPCGLVYTALLLAALSGDVINASLGMLTFGLGTLPAVIGAGIISDKLSNTLRKPKVRKLFGLMMIVLAVLIMTIPMDHSDHTIHKHPDTHHH
ncbi:MAG: sulfite exporter TauE/SafE family protein [Gammaproteobacteria bacterium]